MSDVINFFHFFPIWDHCARRKVEFDLSGEILVELDYLKYLGALIFKKGGVEEDVIVKVNGGTKVP